MSAPDMGQPQSCLGIAARYIGDANGYATLAPNNPPKLIFLTPDSSDLPCGPLIRTAKVAFRSAGTVSAAKPPH